MRYAVTTNRYGSYELRDEQDNCHGTLIYNNWGAYRATITAPGGIEFKLAPTGFWQTSVAVTKDDRAIAEIKAVFGRGLNIFLGDGIYPYNFRKKSFWNGDYAMFNEDNYEVAFIQSHIKWNLTSNYEVEIYSNTPDAEINLILPLLLTYCARYMRMRHSGT